MGSYSAIWRRPTEETLNLYPGLVVDDDRVTGSITFGRSRLPLWAVVGLMVRDGWEGAAKDYPTVNDYGFGADDMADFLYDLMELRGEFGRLLLVLADEERKDHRRNDAVDERSWWDIPRSRTRVLRQLRSCIEAIESTPARPKYSHWQVLGDGVLGKGPEELALEPPEIPEGNDGG